MTPPTKTKKSFLTTKCPLRRPPLVDTNTLSYDRTDPFQAISALRRLVGLLASRIGGCQYRFTPDEHKLSLHLLTIIEPFVGLSPSRRTLTRQPTEILDAIVFHVDSKRDLLALALSCRRLHTVIFPRHYDYRVLYAKASSINIWNHLITNRALARNVRAIEIIDERSSKQLVLPADILKTNTDLESSDDGLTLHSKQEKLLISALTKMTSIQSFHWSCNHSTISMDNLWETLMKCQTLSQVSISNNLIFFPHTPDKATLIDPKFNPGVCLLSRYLRAPPDPQAQLPELKSVALQATKHVFGSTKTPALSRISSMLTGCPNLEVSRVAVRVFGLIVHLSSLWTLDTSAGVDWANTSRLQMISFSAPAGPLSALSLSLISAAPPSTASNLLLSSSLLMPTSRSSTSTFLLTDPRPHPQQKPA